MFIKTTLLKGLALGALTTLIGYAGGASAQVHDGGAGAPVNPSAPATTQGHTDRNSGAGEQYRLHEEMRREDHINTVPGTIRKDIDHPDIEPGTTYDYDDEDNVPSINVIR